MSSKEQFRDALKREKQIIGQLDAEVLRLQQEKRKLEGELNRVCTRAELLQIEIDNLFEALVKTKRWYQIFINFGKKK